MIYFNDNEDVFEFGTKYITISNYHKETIFVNCFAPDINENKNLA